jgi:uncharacterized pyridoxamine 5'-phosphate oxidase family protein
MKNVRDCQLKKCIFMSYEEFREVFQNIFGVYDGEEIQIDVEYEFDGLYFCGITDEQVYKEVSKYFDVTVTSIHADDCEFLGVWICYKEEQ